jgi:hypothetical protein
MLPGVLCGVLGFLQYRWTGQIAEAERSALFEDLRARLDAFTRAFNQEISDDCYALTPAPDQFKAMGPEQAYSEQYARWKPAHGRLFQHIALAVPHAEPREGIDLLNIPGNFLARTGHPAGIRCGNN